MSRPPLEVEGKSNTKEFVKGGLSSTVGILGCDNKSDVAVLVTSLSL